LAKARQKVLVQSYVKIKNRPNVYDLKITYPSAILWGNWFQINQRHNWEEDDRGDSYSILLCVYAVLSSLARKSMSLSLLAYKYRHAVAFSWEHIPRTLTIVPSNLLRNPPFARCRYGGIVRREKGAPSPIQGSATQNRSNLPTFMM